MPNCEPIKIKLMFFFLDIYCSVYYSVSSPLVAEVGLNGVLITVSLLWSDSIATI
jgi:hypothetical protein